MQGNKVVFPFDVPYGTRVAIIWQDATADKPLYAHNYSSNSHPYLLNKIKELTEELANVISSQQVQNIASSKIEVHNQNKEAHPHLLSQLSLKADKTRTYNAIQSLEESVIYLKEYMLKTSDLESYYKKSGGPINGAVEVKSSDNYIIGLKRIDKENHLKISIDNEGTILILNSDADGAHGIELRKDGSLYLRKRIAGLNGYRTFKVLTEEDI